VLLAFSHGKDSLANVEYTEDLPADARPNSTPCNKGFQGCANPRPIGE
jgi:hypothetical protein